MVKYGAPEGIIGWIDEPNVELSRELMGKSDLILATGGPGMVRAVYSSGRPAIGVGAGNTPVIIDKTADIKMTVNYILLSKTFDNGVICASEQSVIIDEAIYDKVRKEFEMRGAYILKKDEIDKVRKIMFIDGILNADIVGQSAYKIAKMAGLKVSEDIRVLIGEVKSTGEEEPFAHEKLSPILAMYKSKNFDESLRRAEELIDLGGLGHTSLLYINLAEKDKIDEFGRKMKTGRILINMPDSLGAIGDVFNFKLEPSLTFGCGLWGGNSVSENVGVKHLINVKTIAERRENMLWFKVPQKIYFKYGSLPTALEKLKGEHKKAFIVTDKTLAELGYTSYVTRVLDENNIDYRIFSEVNEDPTLSSTQAGAKAMLLTEVIRYNSVEAPTKMGVFPQYRYSDAMQRYAVAADFFGLGGKIKEEKLIEAIEKLKAEIGILASIKEWGVPEKDFLDAVDQMALDAFDDQCTSANPRYPLISELKEIYLKSYYGKEYKKNKK